MKTTAYLQIIAMIATLFTVVPNAFPQAAPRQKPPAKAENDAESAKTEQAAIGVETTKNPVATHTTHPDAQWFPDAGLGLFIHWGVASVRAINISWPMRPGRALAKAKLSPEEQARVVREGDYNLNGKPMEITPEAYWSQAKDFNPKNYDPDKWLKAAKAAGFTYAVLTTRHHEGFALWPSAYGDFNTKNYMGGRDLVKDFVEACRRNGLKVGLYYSPPDWHFDRDFMNFVYDGGSKMNPELPALGPDLKPRTTQKPAEEKVKHQAEYARMVKGQVEELLTRYGKIDLLWFDGKPPIPNGNNVITIERIRELQPGIVINPRLHGHGDFVTYERTLGTDRVGAEWAEFCNTWTNSWPHVAGAKFRSDGYVLGQLAKARSLGVNYLLGVGPMSTGEFTPEIYQNMSVVAECMKRNGRSVHAAKPLPAGETASVPATAEGSTRYMFAIPQFKDGGTYDKDMLPLDDLTITLSGVGKPSSVKLLGSGETLKYEYAGRVLTVHVPASLRTKLVDVIKVDQ